MYLASLDLSKRYFQIGKKSRKVEEIEYIKIRHLIEKYRDEKIFNVNNYDIQILTLSDLTEVKMLID